MSRQPNHRAVRRGFSLVELTVSLVILSILASLALAGIAGAQRRAKAEKTSSTIRKLHEIIVPRYESYIRRRVTVSGTSMTQIAQSRLVKTRLLMAQEMPHSWADVSGVDLNGNPPAGLTAPARAYASYKKQLAANATNTTWATKQNEFQSSECLAMIVFRGGFAGEDVEKFRADEIADVDKDGAIEFIDGWGQPIAYIRWPVGYFSMIQSQNAAIDPDPFDPMRISTLKVYPSRFATQRDYAVVPLIFSGGPDGASSSYGIKTGNVVWTTLLSSSSPPLTTRVEDAAEIAGYVNDPSAAADNITNHDLFQK